MTLSGLTCGGAFGLLLLLFSNTDKVQVDAFAPLSSLPFSVASRLQRSPNRVDVVVDHQTSSFTSLNMCGLVAAIDDLWTSDQTTTSANEYKNRTDLLQPAILEQTTRLLDHRGPDGYQIHHSDLETSSSSSTHKWGMGHTRLAIVDPSNRQADMPFALNFDNVTIHLAANGEIYNHERLYETMQQQDNWNYRRTSGSDCEIIGHAYARYGGPEMVQLLDGMFAFVIYEQDALTGDIRQAFAARDPVGIKPLYYGKSGDSWVFASELKALVGHVDAGTVVAVPPGHYWTPQTGLVCYYNPQWLREVRC